MTAHFDELLRVLLEQVVPLEWKSGADQRAVGLSLPRNVNGPTIHECSTIFHCCKNLGTCETANDCGNKLTIADGRNRRGVLRKSVNEVRRSVEWIDDKCQTCSSNFRGWRKLFTD